MKVFISADIEGIATTTTHDDCRNTSPTYAYHCEQMTSEVVAACEGAIEAGATQIVIKDAHGPANNIDIKRLPACAIIIRNWSGHPYGMVEGLDSSFDACLFVGYHNAASRNGNPLSHTTSGRPYQVRINGRIASEFMVNSFVAAYEGVPTVYLSGDRQLCDDYRDLHPALVTTPVKDGHGAATISIQPQLACDKIRIDVEKSLKQDLKAAKITLPEHFAVEVCYKLHTDATKNSYFPGARLIDDTTIAFNSDNYFEVARFLRWVL